MAPVFSPTLTMLIKSGLKAYLLDRVSVKGEPLIMLLRVFLRSPFKYVFHSAPGTVI